MVALPRVGTLDIRGRQVGSTTSQIVILWAPDDRRIVLVNLCIKIPRNCSKISQSFLVVSLDWHP